MELRVELNDDERSGRDRLSPRAIWLGERRLAVLEVLDRWAGEDFDHVKIRAEDQGVYILRREARSGLWALAAYRAPGVPAAGAAKRAD